jgi:hypothetical protein
LLPSRNVSFMFLDAQAARSKEIWRRSFLMSARVIVESGRQGKQHVAKNYRNARSLIAARYSREFSNRVLAGSKLAGISCWKTPNFPSIWRPVTCPRVSILMR